MLHPLDEFPVHQTPLSMSQVGTSDKNFYDRCYFNAHDRTGDVFVITGLGAYANLGVGLDLTWEGSFDAIEEEPHVINNGYRTILQSSRFAQLGTWKGEVRVA